MTPFERLILFAGAATIGGALAAAALYLSPWVTIGALAGGFLLAALTTVETTPEQRNAEDYAKALADLSADRRGLRSVTRRETEQRARESRDE